MPCLTSSGCEQATDWLGFNNWKIQAKLRHFVRRFLNSFETFETSDTKYVPTHANWKFYTYLVLAYVIDSNSLGKKKKKNEFESMT
jgi:hypothetical protein